MNIYFYRTNLPKEVMGFPDYPFPSDREESYIHHSDVLKYLENYAEEFNLYQCIQVCILGGRVEAALRKKLCFLPYDFIQLGSY